MNSIFLLKRGGKGVTPRRGFSEEEEIPLQIDEALLLRQGPQIDDLFAAMYVRYGIKSGERKKWMDGDGVFIQDII